MTAHARLGTGTGEPAQPRVWGMSAKSAVPGASRQRRDAAKTQAELLAVATEEFARVGFFGARVDEIAARTATTKRMIYYYFTDKEGLFTAVLEKAYADIRAMEQALDLGHMAPIEGLRVLIRHTFDYHEAHPELARLVAAENAFGASHLQHSSRAAGVNLPIITLLDDLLERGRAQGFVRRPASALDLHLLMTSVALFRTTNAATIAATFGVDMRAPAYKQRIVALLTDMVLSWLATPADEPALEVGALAAD